MSMEIVFTKEQFRTLVKLLYLGEWVANSHRLRDESLKEYSELEQHILEIAEKKGFAELAEYEGELKRVFPTSDLEEEMHKLIDENEEVMFWDKLSDWMAERDLRREFGFEALKSMDRDEYATRFFHWVGIYEKEFEKYGLERLEIVKKKGGSHGKKI